MKRILTILLLLTSFVVSAQTIGIKIATPIIKNNPIDKTITGYANLLSGGYHVVGTYHGRDSLNTYYTPTLLIGMLVYETAVDSTYRWSGSAWVSALGINIYNSNGTILGPRRVSMGTQSLSFDNNSTLGSLALQLDATPSNETVNISAGTNNYSKAIFNTGYINIFNRDSATNTTEKIVLSPQNMEFDDDNNHGAHYGDSTAMPLDGSYIPDVAWINSHFTSSVGGPFLPIAGGIELGPVAFTYTANVGSGYKVLNINPVLFANINNASAVALAINGTYNSNGHTGFSGVDLTVQNEAIFGSDVIINSNTRTNNIKVQYNAATDTLHGTHSITIRDTTGAQLGRWWNTGQLEVGSTFVKSAYTFHVTGTAQISGNINTPGLATGTATQGVYLDASNNLIKGSLPTGGVSSVFGRTGTVIAQPSDYANKQSSLTLIYQNNHFTSGNLASDFTATGFTPTINTALNSISFSGGGGSSTEYLLINNLTNNDQLVDFAVEGVATSITGGGIRIGKQSINPMTTEHITGKFDLSTNTWSVGTQLNNNDLFGAVTPYVVAAGDQFRLVLHHRENQFTYTFTDITQGFTTETPVVTQNLNAGNWVITYDGGSVDITGVKIVSYTPSYTHIAVFGDSKTLYNIPGNYPNEIGLGNVNVFAGRADATPQLLACIPYWVKYFKCDYAVLNIGRNDIAYGYSLASTMTNYNSIVSSLSGTGATVVHLLPIPEKPASGVNQSALVGAIKAAYPGQYVDVRAYGYDSTTMTQPDNVHPLPQGSKVIGYAINASTLIPAQATLYNEYEQQVRNVVNTPNTITPNTFSAPQTFTPATNTVTRRILTHPTNLIDLQIDDNPSSVSSALTISTGQYSSLIEKSASLINTELSATSTATHSVNAFVSSRGTLASPTSLNSGDVIKQFTFYGFEGTTAQPTAFFRSVVDGTPSTGNMPQRFEWGTGTGATAAIKLSLLSTGQLNKASTDIANGTTFRDISLTTAITPIANNSTLTGVYIAPTFNTGTGILTLSTATTSTADGTYTLLPALGGTGSGAVFTAVVTGGNVVFTQTTGGIGYTNGDNITFSALTGATPTVTALGYSGGLQHAVNIVGMLKYDPTGTNATGNTYFRNSSGQMQQLAIGANGTIYTPVGGLPSWAVTLPTAAIPAFTNDVTNTAGNTSLTIGANKVTYAKMQVVTTNKLLGSGSGTAVAEITLGTGLSFSGTTLNATGGSGTVTSITPGYGFTSSTPITTSGTLTIDTTKLFTVANFNPKLWNQNNKYNSVETFNNNINMTGNGNPIVWTGTFNGSLSFTTLSATQVVTLPNESGNTLLYLYKGQATLSSGVFTTTTGGVSTTSKAFVTFVSPGGTVSTTWQYKAVCTANTITISAITNTGVVDTTDSSTLNYFITN